MPHMGLSARVVTDGAFLLRREATSGQILGPPSVTVGPDRGMCR
jgi:hypothetical protein